MNLKKILIIVGIILIILLGVYLGSNIYKNSEQNNTSSNNTFLNSANNMVQENLEISSLQASIEEEKTTPNTLIIYKTYYTKCKHYIQEYKDIDASMVNCTEAELKERCREEGWKIEEFSPQEIVMTKEEEKFCNQHYKLKLENQVIVVYTVDEDGREVEYEQTGITTEYLTQEDILKLTTGIMVYGMENLTSTIEDYE